MFELCVVSLDHVPSLASSFFLNCHVRGEQNLKIKSKSQVMKCLNHDVMFDFKIQFEPAPQSTIDILITIYELPPDDDETKYGEYRLSFPIGSELKVFKGLLQDCKANSFLEIRIGPKELHSDASKSSLHDDQPNDTDLTFKTILSPVEQKLLADIWKQFNTPQSPSNEKLSESQDNSK